MHSKLPVATMGAVCALVLALSPSAALARHGGHHGHGHGHGHNLIRADLTPSMPMDPPINEVNPGTLPWILSRGEVRVRESGRMDVRIEGLQIPRNGSADNPVPAVDAVLYCGGVAVADSGAQTLTVPDGDARFRVFLTVPSTCDSATVLISPSTAVGALYIASAMADEED